MCLSVLLSACLSPGGAQTKQTAVFMKQGRATRVFCLVVQLSTHSHMLACAHIRTPKCPALLIFYLPCSVAFLPPCAFCSVSLSLMGPLLLGVMLACSQTERNATPCDLSPTTRRGAGLDKGARGQLQSCARGCKETHTDMYIRSQVVG